MTYFDPHAGAQANGYAHGRVVGEEEGFRKGEEVGYAVGQRDGYNAGHLEGHTTGHTKGWNEAVKAADVEMQKQIAFTRQYLADKHALAEQLQAQSLLIEQLTTKLDEMELKNTQLKDSNHGLRDVITALKVANENLQEEVSLLDEKLKEKTKAYNDQLWQYNRSVVFMNSVRTVLEDLTSDSGPQADRIRKVFSKRYSEHIHEALRKGTIRVPLDQDDALTNSLPRTQKFIANMLNSVRDHAPVNIREAMVANEKVDIEDHDSSPSP